MNRAFRAVKVFHRAFGHPIATTPTLLDTERVVARASWMSEEILEFLRAKTIAEQADAMIDLLYFALGTLVEMGIPPQELFDVVQQANMSKLWPDGKPHYREDGKVIKPEGWQAPEPQIQAIIQRMSEC